ncbi:uncharacterized protein DUF4062 [Edaphobacter aggregans]|uniref:Uncharacterized protein DUF4062 n=1 Tax=Edaphobacter aggregans TaxID=570835 RepID=A0A428MMP4_9BACT|nr:uncharacterized protein DUF4062 [Edaphobacter aggregans]
MSFDCDAFISYTHIDNVSLVDGSKGWITNLHRALEIRVGQLLGETPEIWRDPKLTGNDVFENTLVEQLKRVAVLITVVSPRYVKSEWTRRELVEFWKAAEAQGGVKFHDKARIFKVLKTPIPRQMDPPELQPLLGYEFFHVDAETGRVRELDDVFGAQAQKDFWMKLDDLAHDIAGLLEILQGESLEGVPGVKTSTKEAVFLAETTADLKEQREAIRRDLQQHGYTVLPAQGLPLVASEMKTSLEEDLAQCRMSIHPIGKNYGLVPEGSSVSLLEIQNELAIERGKRGGFVRLLWIPAGLQVEDERQAKLIQQFRMDPRMQAEADLLETFLEDLETVIHDRLREEKPKIAQQNGSLAIAEGCRGQIYLIYDQRDASIASLYADALFNQGFEILHPTFEGDEAEVRQYHEDNLRVCNGVLIFFGSANEGWVRRKLREVQKSVGYGRTGPLPGVTISCVGAKTAEKERFRTHEAPVIFQMDGFSADILSPFISRLKS